MRIVCVHFQIEPDGRHETLYHVELDAPLPADAKLYDVIETDPHSLGSRFELWSVSSPSSNRCDVRPLNRVELEVPLRVKKRQKEKSLP